MKPTKTELKAAREGVLIYTTPEGTFAEQWGRGIRVNQDGTTTDITRGEVFEPVDDDQDALNELFALDERPVFDSVPASVLDRPLKRQDIFDVEAITSKLRHKSPRNQRRAIEKAFKKRQAQ